MHNICLTKKKKNTKKKTLEKEMKKQRPYTRHWFIKEKKWASSHALNSHVV